VNKISVGASRGHLCDSKAFLLCKPIDNVVSNFLTDFTDRDKYITCLTEVVIICVGSREETHFEAMKDDWSLSKRESACNGTLTDGCYTTNYVADVFFFSCLIFLGTFVLSFYLKQFRNTRFFPNKAS